MFQADMNPPLASVTARKLSHVELVFRRLREGGQISGSGTLGASAPRPNVPDTAVMLVTLLAMETPGDALDALTRARGLIGDVGGRPVELVGLVELILRELLERGSLSGGVADLILSVGHPWPIAGLEMTFEDGQKTVTEFHHVDAIGPDADSRRAELEKRWGYVPGTGGNRWAAMRLHHFEALADAIAGRTRDQPPHPTVVELLSAMPHMKLPDGGTGAVMARARGGPPAPAGKARRARQPK